MLKKLRRRFLSLFLLTLISNVADFAVCKHVPKLKDLYPKDYPLCIRGDPQLDDCFLRLLVKSRHRYKTGVPEIGVPQLDPFHIDELVAFSGLNGSMTAIARNISASGLTEVEYRNLTTDSEKLTLFMDINIPFTEFTADYELNGKFAEINLKGKGPASGHAANLSAKMILTAKLVEHDEAKFLEFTHIKVFDGVFKDAYVKLEKLLPIKVLNDATNALINRSKFLFYRLYKTIAEKLAGEVIIGLANKVAKNIACDDVFD